MPKRDPLYIAVFLCALAVRLIFVYQWRGLPYAQTPYLDAQAYDTWARAIAAGHWLRAAAFYQAPLYPYFLGLLYRVCGADPVAVGVVQAFLDAGTCTLLSAVSARLFGRGAGWLTGILAALYAPMIFYVAPLMKETLALFSLSVALFMFTSPRIRPLTTGWWFGLAALVRPNVLLLAGVASLFYLRPRRRAFAWFVAGVAIAVAPATLHNWWVSSDLVLINSAGGFNYYIGHGPEATGSNQYPAEISTDPAQEEADTLRLASEVEGHPLKPSEVSSFWLRRGLGTFNPSTEWDLWWQKTLLFFNTFESPDNYDLNFVRAQFPGILHAPLPTFAGVFLLALIGIVGSWSAARPLVLFAFVYYVSVALFYVTDRYRLPVVIFLLPLAGAAWPGLSRLRRVPWLIAPAAVAGLVGGWLTLRPVADPHALDSYNWGLVASLYADAHRDEDAAVAINRALSAKPLAVTAQALIRGGEALERLRKFAEAEKILRLATDLYPKDGLTFHNLGRFLFENARAKEAREAFLKSIAIAPWNFQPYVGLALADHSLGLNGESAWAVLQGERVAGESFDWAKLRETLSH